MTTPSPSMLPGLQSRNARKPDRVPTLDRGARGVATMDGRWFEICRCSQRQFSHQLGAQNRQACLTEEPVSNPTGLPRRARDHSIDIHAELLDRRARGHNPQFQARMNALEVGEAGNKPAHREGRQRRYVEQPTGSRAVLRRHDGTARFAAALVAEQSHSFPDNLVALLSQLRAWNCSPGNV
jgi:hypothetical protein